MGGTMQFTIGAQATCTDGPCGQVTRVVFDPVADVLTHLVVEPEHRQGLGRLVPVGVARPNADGVALDLTLAGFEALDAAEETQFVPGTRGYEVYGPEQVLSWPYYRRGDSVMDPDLEGKVSQTVTVDTIPLGEVAVRRGEPVHAVDGPIGHVDGLVIEPGNDHVTHVLLQEGHLWGRKEVAIPISAVTGDEDGITLRLSKQQIQDLPPVDVAR
jgi:hypothetical protein